MGTWTAIVPIKPTESAKSRLVHHSAEHRRDLSVAFAADALLALSNAAMVERVLVVGAWNPALTTLESDLAVEVLPDAASGLNPALIAAAGTLPPSTPLCVMVGDLPAVTPEQIDAALTAAEGHERSIISDAQGTGTTTLMVQQAAFLQPLFGHRSRAAHVRSGAIDLMRVRAPGMRRDVDTEVDLWDAQRLGVGPHTRAALARTTAS